MLTKNYQKSNILTFMLILSVSLPSYSDVPYKVYNTLHKEDFFQNYMHGVGNGFKWANVMLGMDGKPQLYCSPKKLIVTRENYLNILDKQVIELKDYLETKPELFLEIVLMNGLKKTFPCK